MQRWTQFELQTLFPYLNQIYRISWSNFPTSKPPSRTRFARFMFHFQKEALSAALSAMTQYSTATTNDLKLCQERTRVHDAFSTTQRDFKIKTTISCSVEKHSQLFLFFCWLNRCEFSNSPLNVTGWNSKEEESMYRRAKVTHVQQHFNVLYQPYRVVSFCLSYWQTHWLWLFSARRNFFRL